ncbi:MAG: ABC transporter permease [Firmicutes bacterium]|nr:ABC transporter permease [Bacillota bacterium]MBQ4093381.1 ABC transporter permease [Bacillota bacterium]
MKNSNGLLSFVGKQTAKFIILIIAISMMTFVLVAASPIDPVAMNTGQAAYSNMSPEKKAQLEEYWGVDTPITEKYVHWVNGVLHGDWGISLRYNQPVMEVVGERFANSLMLMLTAWIFSGVIGLILGVVAGTHRGKLIDRIVQGYSLTLAAVPTFWLALVMLMIFAVWLGWFPIGMSVPIGVAAADVTIWDRIYHLILPALTLSVIGVANIALHTREKVIDIMESDYYLYAIARGESKWHAVRHHALRNLLLPAITLQFASISEIFGGSVLVEQVFSYPGLGNAAVTAGLGGDAALLVGIAIVSACFVYFGNLTANILYGVVDPRIRRGQGIG